MAIIFTPQQIEDRLCEVFSRSDYHIELKENLKKIFEHDDYEQLISMKGYAEYYVRISQARENLDNCRTDCNVILHFLHDRRKGHSLKLYSNLIKKMIKTNWLYDSWKIEEKNKFIKISEIIINWNDFFFSYTDRANDVNLSAPRWLKPVIKESKGHKKDTNLIAAYILKRLANEQLSFFYDKEHIKFGDLIMPELINNCKHSFAFVQVIDEIIFREPANNPNYCYEEYQFFKEVQNKHHMEPDNFFFIQISAERLIVPYEPHEDYNKWINDFKQYHRCKIEKFNDLTEFKIAIMEVARLIVEYRNNSIKNLIENFNM